MRKIILAALAASIVTPGAASAQSYREVRQGQQEVRQGQRDLRQDLRRGDYREAAETRRELREDRRELREDWQDYRQSHRSQYKRAAYVAPRGYTYRAVAPGARLNAAFYRDPYRLTNYAGYRLPRPGISQHYFRYGNDVVLVNIRTGNVIRVYNNFFW